MQFAYALTNSNTAVEPEWDRVVMIYSEGLDANDRATGQCNALALTNSILVTSAHCVHHAYLLKEPNIIIQSGSYLFKSFDNQPPRNAGYRINYNRSHLAHFYFLNSARERMKKYAFKAKFQPHEDIALIKLANQIESSFEKSNLMIMSEKILRETQNNFIHYWPTVVSINFIETISHLNARQSARLNKLSVENLYFKSRSLTRVGPGDSGSPLFIRSGSNWYLAGVTKGRAETLISNWDVFTQTGNNLCLLLQQALSNQDQLTLEACQK